MPAQYQPEKGLQAELADTEEKRLKGLSGRDHLDEEAGMLFVFDKPAIQCMWSKDVKFPLSVGFLTEDGNLIDTVDMEAGDATPHCSTEPVLYVLEVNKGWFARHR